MKVLSDKYGPDQTEEGSLANKRAITQNLRDQTLTISTSVIGGILTLTCANKALEHKSSLEQEVVNESPPSTDGTTSTGVTTDSTAGLLGTFFWVIVSIIFLIGILLVLSALLIYFRLGRVARAIETGNRINSQRP
jgi:hypothetical protein